MKTLLLLATCLALTAPTGKVFHTREQALELAFGKASVQRTSHYWSKEERARIAEQAGVVRTRPTHVEFRARTGKGGVVPGRSAWFDTRLVRSRRQTIMVVVDAEQRIEQLVLCDFDEPLDYKPVDRWYAQFKGRRLDEEMQLKKGIHGVSGATLTARATVASVREILAAHAVAHPVEPKK